MVKRKDGASTDGKRIVSIGIIVALVAVVAIIFLLPGIGSASDPNGLPAFARTSDRIKEAYLFARDNPEKPDGIRCYCGCMEKAHAGRIHQRGLLDCFVKEDNSFDTHGANCRMCVDDILEVKTRYTEGKTKEEINQIIGLKHANDPKSPVMNK